MKRINQTGLFITLLAVVLLVAQFVITFAQPLRDLSVNKEGIVALMIHLTPYVLLLIGLYILFVKKTPSIKSVWSRIFLTAITSWGLAGAVFLVIVVLALIARGSEGVETVFSYLAAISIILTVCFFPLVYRRIKTQEWTGSSTQIRNKSKRQI